MSPITCSGMIYFVNHFPKNIKFHPSNPVTTTFQTGYNNYPNRLQPLFKLVTTTFQTGYNHFSNWLQPLFKLVTTTFQTGYNNLSKPVTTIFQTGYNHLATTTSQTSTTIQILKVVVDIFFLGEISIHFLQVSNHPFTISYYHIKTNTNSESCIPAKIM